MIIAQRTLFIRTDAEPIPVPIKIFAPQDCEGHWQCGFEIGWPESVRCFAEKGLDPVQALQLALPMIGIELYASDYHKNGVLYAEGQNGGYGFPIARNRRDL